MVDLNEMSELLQKGKRKDVKRMTEEAIAEGMDPEVILNEGLLSGMGIIGEKFKNNQVFVPEVLIAARAMNAGTALLEAALLEKGVKPIGKALIGTVKGDLHDIGKNLVAMMLKGAGLEVIDIGTDVDAETYIQAAVDNDVDLILMSSLLTTTMTYMKEVIDLLEEKGLRDKFKVIVGGAPITQEFSDEIGADGYSADAGSAAEDAKRMVS